MDYKNLPIWNSGIYLREEDIVITMKSKKDIYDNNLGC